MGDKVPKEINDLYVHGCTDLVGELHPIMARYMKAYAGIGHQVAMGALMMEMLHIIYHDFCEEDRDKILEDAFSQVKTALKGKKVIESLKASIK